jgi:hypothetical protein
MTPEDADDLIQEFVTGKILEKDLISRADRNLGRFRNFLLTALDRFYVDRVRHASAKKRSPCHARRVEVCDHDTGLRSYETPARVFDVTWARGVVTEALGRMRCHCESSGRNDLWGVFQCRVMYPILEGAEPVKYSKLVQRFGLKSPAHAWNALISAKRMFARTLRCVVAEYCCNDDEVQAEIVELRGILASNRN